MQGEILVIFAYVELTQRSFRLVELNLELTSEPPR